jgi:cysteine desulfurase
VTYLPVQQNGIVSLEDMEKAVRPGQTVLVSVMGVNNEIGVVQPLKEISEVTS